MAYWYFKRISDDSDFFHYSSTPSLQYSDDGYAGQVYITYFELEFPI
jgi:hypothetical protein